MRPAVVATQALVRLMLGRGAVLAAWCTSSSTVRKRWRSPPDPYRQLLLPLAGGGEICQGLGIAVIGEPESVASKTTRLDALGERATMLMDFYQQCYEAMEMWLANGPYICESNVEVWNKALMVWKGNALRSRVVMYSFLMKI